MGLFHALKRGVKRKRGSAFERHSFSPDKCRLRRKGSRNLEVWQEEYGEQSRRISPDAILAPVMLEDTLHQMVALLMVQKGDEDGEPT